MRVHESEVEQLGDVVQASPLTDHDVFGLDVAMNQTNVMGFPQSGANLSQEMNASVRRQRTMRIDSAAFRG